jgi:2-polyprenyl-3-methyl-5-hydroxy-6-metoxy-1,4-benzoquinol methylase
MASIRRAPTVENGVVVGNTTDKYAASNPLTRMLVERFCQAVGGFAEQLQAETILEVGCGEGHVTRVLLQRTAANIHATDISDQVLAEARENVESPRVTFENRNIYDLEPQRQAASLVVCCEVLEHLDDPQKGLQLLARAAAPYAILSVPREPLWRVLNMARGAYLGDWGNTPGHLQHWSKRGFQAFVAQEFEIMQVCSPLPWTVLLARSRQAAV